MRIVFVCAEDETPAVCYLSAYLKKNGHEVYLVFDPKQFDRAYIRNEKLTKFFGKERSNDNLERIGEIQPGLICFSCTTAHYQWALNFARLVKNRFPKIPIIFGGVHPTLVPERVIKEKCVDFICIGEGERPLLELVKKLELKDDTYSIRNIWYKRGKVVVKNLLRPLLENLDELPYADKELFRDFLPAHYFTHSYFFTSRGCPYNCSFCGNEGMKKIYSGLGVYVRRMSPERAIEELIILKEKYGARYILFEDDVFAIDNEWLKRFLPLYQKKLALPFTCFGHTHSFSLETARMLKKAGCNLLWFGVQSANEQIRREVFNRYETNIQIKNTARICHKTGIKFMVDHILNIPFDNHEAIKEAILLYNDIRPDMINCYRLLCFPKAGIIDKLLEAKMITKKDIDLIEEGKSVVYQTGEYFYQKNDYYQKYALIITLIPLFPKIVVKKIAQNDKIIAIFGKLPIFFVPLAKVWLNFKAGHGFLPIAILRMEFYFTKQFINSKLLKFIKLYKMRYL